MNLQILVKQLNPKYTKVNEPLASYTTLKIGGPADILYEAHTVQDLIKTVTLAKEHEVPVTILGQGSNVLIADAGIRGLVIKNSSDTIKIKGEKPVSERNTGVSVTPRWESDSVKGTFKYEFKDLDYDESDKPRIEVMMDSGVSLPFAINFLLDNKITGLQWYSGIPGTIGGALFNNIHGGTHFLSEVIQEVTVLDKSLKIKKLPISEIGVDYDKSRFHKSGEIILQATFNLFKGDIEKAQFTVLEWAKRKSIQPKNSPGCAFANITQEQKEKFGYPTTGTGYIVEHILKMTGFRIGDAAISTAHHNFIINEGKATAKDYLAVMKEIAQRTHKELDIKLIPEIILLGFSEDEIKMSFPE
jgi:UDP-N-acetylmuramate dehydrogenase